MSKLEEISLAELISQISICLAARSLYDIWRDDLENVEIKKTIGNPEGKKAIEILQDRDYADELVDEPGKLGRFLFEHETEIDNVKFAMSMLRNYQDSIARGDLTPEVKAEYERNIITIRRLLKGTNETFVYYSWESKTGRIEQLIIEDTKDVAEGKSRPRKMKNVERLQALEEDENFGNIIQSLLTSDVENIICYNKKVGTELRFMVEYNSVLDSFGGDHEAFSKSLQQKGFDGVVNNLGDSFFVDEMVLQLKTYIEEIDIDKMLICSALRYLEGIQYEMIPRENAADVYQRLQIIQKHVKKNAEISFRGADGENTTYGTRTLEKDMKKFIREGENIYYLPVEKCYELRNKILEGTMLLGDISVQIFDALTITKQELTDLLKRDPNNYIFFLRQNENCPYQKAQILKDIIDSKQCSTDLLQLLSEKTDITPEEVCNLFDKGIISVGDLKSVREQVGQIITDKQLFEKYQQYKAIKTAPHKTETMKAHLEELEAARTELETYALAYRNTELAGKTNEQQEERGEEFVAEVGDEIEPADLVTLYGLDIIPLKVAVDWGGENIIEKLLRNETLKPADARYLRDNGLLDEKVLERLFKNSVNMSYSYQVALVCTVFDGQTPEEQEIREKLAQYYHIENAIGSSSKKGHMTNRKVTRGEEAEPKQNVKMRDPGAKYNLLSSLDNDVRIEEGIIDGHIIFHYPNIEEGTVIIEKLHKITTNKETGLIEIKADNESATYVLSEEEFIKMKTQLIKDGRVDRTELTQRWWITRDPRHWMPHAGISSWERALKERFEISEENSRYSPEDLAKIEDLIAKSIESKKGEER